MGMVWIGVERKFVTNDGTWRIVVTRRVLVRPPCVYDGKPCAYVGKPCVYGRQPLVNGWQVVRKPPPPTRITLATQAQVTEPRLYEGGKPVVCGPPPWCKSRNWTCKPLAGQAYAPASHLSKGGNRLHCGGTTARRTVYLVKRLCRWLETVGACFRSRFELLQHAAEGVRAGGVAFHLGPANDVGDPSGVDEVKRVLREFPLGDGLGEILAGLLMLLRGSGDVAAIHRQPMAVSEVQRLLEDVPGPFVGVATGAVTPQHDGMERELGLPLRERGEDLVLHMIPIRAVVFGGDGVAFGVPHL